MLCRHRKSMAELQQTWHGEVFRVAIWARRKEGLILPSTKTADAGQAGSREGDGARRGQDERGSPSRLRQQVDCTEHWERAGVAPIPLPPFLLPKQVPQPNEVYFQEENDMMLLCGLILCNSKSNFKSESKWVEKFIKVIANRCSPVERSCNALIRTSG